MALLRETPRSLRLYLGVVGVFNLAAVALDAKLAGNALATAALIAQGILGAGYLYFAVKLREVLRERSGQLIAFLVTALVFAFGLGVYVYLRSQTATAFPVIQVAITAYLIFQVRRLAHEATEPDRRAATFD